MGKKKSVALIVLVTVVLLGLLFICFAPTFRAMTPYDFRSLLGNVELGSDLGGGYSTVYYPEGVISQSEYDQIVALYAEGETSGDTSELENPADYTRHKGVYLSNDLMEGQAVSQSFADSFAVALKTLRARFAAKGYADYSVAVQDDYTVAVKVPYDNETPGDLFETFARGGALILSSETITSVSGQEAWTRDDIKDFDLSEGAKIEFNTTIENRVPAYLNLEVKAIDANGNEMSNDEIKVEVSTEVLASAKEGQSAETPLAVVVTEGTQGAFKRLDGLTFRVAAAAQSSEGGKNPVTGQTLNARKHFLIARDITVKLVGKIIGDFN